METIDDVGEFGLIARVQARLPLTSPDTPVPAGDDAALLNAPDGRLAVSTDLLLEGNHFRRDWSSPRDIGHKAAAQNFSDIVAMGGVPTSLLLSMVLPGDLPVAWVEEFAEGVAGECAGLGAIVAGGDMVRGELITISVTVLGTLEGRAPVLRSGARPGDTVAVAGRLGWSAAGLELLLSGEKTGVEAGDGAEQASGGAAQAGPSGSVGSVAVPAEAGSAGSVVVPLESGSAARSVARPGAGPAESAAPQPADYLSAHRRPSPPYAAGPQAARAGATAMLDVSDGLLADLTHLAVASGVAVDVDSALAVTAPGPRLDLVLTGGEDHALVATFAPGAGLPEGWRPIGTVHEGSAAVTVDGKAWDGAVGWSHFGHSE
ncbi:thiamine-phosphate kinase [Catenulispora sp. NL8]|uniref:Thiamine-monophosphate kinase n=1 Tax=Catenulispora pinistramenti TaxID=2705254 RepID=A0ABS5KLU2_9ACTN|nr:thiamine-monophosphate kinase [Catenulispora pinistramenti]MBS2547023.1 thiamine-phosphate kinase [Catenulispora pinistramenti]